MQSPKVVTVRVLALTFGVLFHCGCVSLGCYILKTGIKVPAYKLL